MQACDIWVAQIKDAKPSMKEFLAPIELERLANYKREVDKQRFLVGCALTRLVLSHHLRIEPRDIEICRRCKTCGKPHGKPRLLTGCWQFSIAHAGIHVLLAVCRNSPVGVDIEPLCHGNFSIGLAQSFLSKNELINLQKVDSDALPSSLLVYWTRKEAVLKCLGIGLEMNPQLISVSAPSESPMVKAWPPELLSIKAMHMYDIHALPAYVGCLAAGESVKVDYVDASRHIF